jgi:protein-tyrosine phosphatase
MDHLNLSDLRAIQPQGYKGHLGILTDFDRQSRDSVIADPYGGTTADFDRAFEHIDRVTRAFFKEVIEGS